MLISGRANFKPGSSKACAGRSSGKAWARDRQEADNPLSQRPGPRQPMARPVPRRGVARRCRMAVADRPERSVGSVGSPERGEARTGWLAAGFVASIVGFAVAMLTLRHARIRPGDVHSLGAPGACRHAGRCSSEDRSSSRSAGSLTRASSRVRVERGPRCASPAQGRSEGEWSTDGSRTHRQRGRPTRSGDANLPGGLGDRRALSERLGGE